MNHTYALEKYSGQGSRYTCPGCGKHKVFTRYINSETGEHLADNVGICNRVVKCGYHYKPKDYFEDNPLERGNAKTTQRKTQFIAHRTTHEERTPSYLPPEYLEMSCVPDLQNNNHLITYLKTVLGNVTDRYVTLFNIGTSKRPWLGATIFWYVDGSGRIRSGKIILFNPITGKRIKEPFSHITWVHTRLLKKGVIKEFNHDLCLFGEHQLITNPHKPVCLVESEKSALIASAYLPEFTWMACGGLSLLSAKRLSAISRNTIVLCPDINGYEAWERKAHDLRTNGFRVTVSSLLEKHPAVTDDDRKAGLDLADFLPRLPLAG